MDLPNLSNMAGLAGADASGAAQDSLLEEAKRAVKAGLSQQGSAESKEAKERKLSKACQDFEALFIAKLWQSMRATVPKDSPLHSSEEEKWQSLFDQEFAAKMSRDGGIGLRAMLMSQLEKRLDPSRSDPPSMRKEHALSQEQGGAGGGDSGPVADPSAGPEVDPGAGGEEAPEARQSRQNLPDGISEREEQLKASALAASVLTPPLAASQTGQERIVTGPTGLEGLEAQARLAMLALRQER